jgi:hypothetical protein
MSDFIDSFSGSCLINACLVFYSMVNHNEEFPVKNSFF